MTPGAALWENTRLTLELLSSLGTAAAGGGAKGLLAPISFLTAAKGLAGGAKGIFGASSFASLFASSSSSSCFCAGAEKMLEGAWGGGSAAVVVEEGSLQMLASEDGGGLGLKSSEVWIVIFR